MPKIRHAIEFLADAGRTRVHAPVTRRIDEAYQRVADDQQQEPGAELVDGHHRPALPLRWIEPDFGERADVLREPDEERHQPEPEQ